MIQLDSNTLQRLGQQDIRAEIGRGLRGIEKESLRVTPGGTIAKTLHPEKFGAALTHPKITTDYSEALLEMVTAPSLSVDDAWNELKEIHQFVYSQLQDEMLWATSMPCIVGGDSEIPIAEFGTSNVGLMKHIYRRGLGFRYGRVMQVISGVHFNYSVPVSLWPLLQRIANDKRPLRQFIDNKYFGLLRNFQRIGWLIPYLFGSSPAVCKSFLGGRTDSLAEFDAKTVYGRYATSLRMSDIGYHNPSQTKLDISYNSLDEYVGGLRQALQTSYPPYERVGVRQNGEYNQLSTSVLQIANEFYSFARPKQIAISGEKPTLALARRGVAYIEVRALDVDPYDPVGISPECMRFVETMLLYCLFTDSPPSTVEERQANQANQSRAACCGRTPDSQLQDSGEQRSLVEWAVEICEALLPIAEMLDGPNSRLYQDAVQRKLGQAENPESTPSARVLAEMREEQESFFEFALRRSQVFRDRYKNDPPSASVLARYQEMASASLAGRAEIEASDTMSFEDYLDSYFAQSELI